MVNGRGCCRWSGAALRVASRNGTQTIRGRWAALGRLMRGSTPHFGVRTVLNDHGFRRIATAAERLG